jgi:hypothetical protein
MKSMAEPSTDLLQEDIINFLARSGVAGKTASDNAVAAKKKASEISDIYKDVSSRAAAIEYQKGTAELQGQQALRKDAQALGVDPRASSDILDQVMGKIRENNATLLMQVDKVTAAKNLSLWEDPMEFMKANFFLPDEQRKLAATVDKAKILDATLQNLNQAVSQTAITQRALEETHTAATVQARTEIAAADALVRSKQAAIEGMKYDTQSQVALAEASSQQISALLQLKGAKDADIRLQQSLEDNVLARERFSWDKATRETAVIAKAAGKTIDEQTREYINISRRTLGQPDLTAEEFAFHSKIAKKSPELSYHLENGMRQVTTGVATIGTTPAESLEVIKEFANNLPEIRNETIGFINQAEELLGKNPVYAGAKPEEKAKQLNRAVKDQVILQHQNIRKDSIFAIGDLSTYLGNKTGKGIANLAALPISQKLLIPAIQAGQPLDDVKTILGLTVDAVSKRTITSNEALGLSTIYQKASQLNQSARGFTAFGIVLPKNGAEYNVRIGKIFGETINMNDPAQVARYLVKNMSTVGTATQNPTPFRGTR